MHICYIATLASLNVLTLLQHVGLQCYSECVESGEGIGTYPDYFFQGRCKNTDSPTLSYLESQ